MIISRVCYTDWGTKMTIRWREDAHEDDHVVRVVILWEYDEDDQKTRRLSWVWDSAHRSGSGVAGRV